MALSLAQKLRIKEGMRLLTVNAPKDCSSHLRSLLSNLDVSPTLKEYEQIHWFVKTKSEMEKELKKIIGALKPEVICWIYYPKGTSSIQTDLTRDKGWESLLSHQELQWLSLISFDDTWSSFGMRLKTDDDKKKEAKPTVRLIFNYVDPVKKTVQLPEDLAAAMKKNKKATTFFEMLSFTNKKEYIEWVVTAKREETRNERVKGTIERLNKNWKNPRNM